MLEGVDLKVAAAVYEVLTDGWDLIRPEPGMDEACGFMIRYLLQCVHENVQADDGQLPTGFEAAYDLAAYVRYLANRLPSTKSVLNDAAKAIAQAYLAAGEKERDRLLNGMLEHALEAQAVRPYFAHWRDDEVLCEPWRLAMEWAIAHGDANA